MFNSINWQTSTPSKYLIALYSFPIGFIVGQQITLKTMEFFLDHNSSSTRHNPNRQKSLSWSIITIPIGIGCITGVSSVALVYLANSKYFSK